MQFLLLKCCISYKGKLLRTEHDTYLMSKERSRASDKASTLLCDKLTHPSTSLAKNVKWPRPCYLFLKAQHVTTKVTFLCFLTRTRGRTSAIKMSLFCQYKHKRNIPNTVLARNVEWPEAMLHFVKNKMK